MNEPVTMLTDYALCALTAIWSALLMRRSRRVRSRAVALWGTGFAALSLASLAGGTYHGFLADIAPRTLAWLWTSVTWAMALASFALLCGAVIASTSGKWRLWLLGAAVAKLAVFAIWGAGCEDFRFVIADYGVALLVILTLAVFCWQRRRAPSAPWILAGVAVSALAALAQQSGLALSARFNQNDLYHVFQALGLFLLYRAGTLFQDRS